MVPPTAVTELLSATEIEKVKKLISGGKLRNAAAVVRGQSGVAASSPVTLATLRAKHPTGPPNPFGPRVGRQPSALKQPALLDKIVTNLDLQTASGISGWSGYLIKLCYSRDGGDDSTANFRMFPRTLANQMWRGTAPGAPMLLCSQLTALLKDSGNGIRPIACGELFYRICMR